MDITQVDYNEKDEIKGLIQEQLNSLSNDMKSVLQDPELSLLQRCLLVSRLFGDESDLHFWTVASHYLQSFAQARQLSVSTAEGQTQSEGTQPSPQNHWTSAMTSCVRALTSRSSSWIGFTCRR